MIPPIKALSAANVESLVCVTAQHRELLDDVLHHFDVKPDFDLNLMKTRQSLSAFVTEALVGLESVIKKAQPDWVLVHGDTSTTFAASLAAFYNRVKVAHVEAGLRSYDKYQPFPEEINRKLTSAIADLHFAPTETARSNLLAENIPENKIIVTGNTAIDMLNFTIKPDYVFQNRQLSEVSGKIILMTAHRRENWGVPLENICHAIKQIAAEFPDVCIIYPVHPNPTVKEIVTPILSDCERIILTEPLTIFDMHNLMKLSYLVLTDSGGLQEEAPALDKPVVVMREVTERPEGELAGTLVLAGTDRDRIYNNVCTLLSDDTEYKKMANAINPFGDGKASGRIVNSLM